MQVNPFQNVTQGTLREIAVDNPALYLDGNLVFPIHRMKVRRDMFPREDTNHNPQESRQLRHEKTIPWCTEVFNSINSNSNFGHIRTVEIEIAIAIGVEFLVFSSISVPIPIWIPIAAAIIRIAATPYGRLDRGADTCLNHSVLQLARTQNKPQGCVYKLRTKSN